MGPIARTALFVVLIIALVGSLPDWRWSQGWGYGYYPTYGLGSILVVLLILALLGRL